MSLACKTPSPAIRAQNHFVPRSPEGLLPLGTKQAGALHSSQQPRATERCLASTRLERTAIECLGRKGLGERAGDKCNKAPQGLTQHERRPAGDPRFQALVEDLVQEHDGFTGKETQSQEAGSSPAHRAGEGAAGTQGGGGREHLPAWPGDQLKGQSSSSHRPVRQTGCQGHHLRSRTERYRGILFGMGRSRATLQALAGLRF